MIGDIALGLGCSVLGLAWLESQCGPGIRKRWHRAYDAVVDAMRRTPPHLRGRKPVECGEGTVSETQLREVAVVTRVRRAPLLRSEGVTDPSWDDVVQAQMERERDARRLALEHERDRQRRMANQPWRDRERAAQMQSRNAYAEFQQDRNSEARRPTPIENAIRNSQERGTW